MKRMALILTLVVIAFGSYVSSQERQMADSMMMKTD